MAGGTSGVQFNLNCKDDSVGKLFKSSFAKSMALSSCENQSKSLDCSALNAALHSRDPEFVGLKRAHLSRPCGKLNFETSKIRRDSCHPRGAASEAGADNPHQEHPDTSKELARLRKELQALQEENQRLQSCASRPGSAAAGAAGAATSVGAAGDTAEMVDNVLLQNQVDTLQWQLRQTENSRHMYRAVMEQVVRFLERAQRNLKLAAANSRPKTPNGRVPRSRSVHTVDCPGRASPRDSLPDFQRAKSITQIEDSQSYSAFRDFTWRRPRPSLSELEEVPPEKLSQEAFRLLRTVQSLLNTREPDLAHRLSGSASGSGDSERSERSSMVSLDPPEEAAAVANGSSKDSPDGTLVGDVSSALRRKLHIRNSQVVSCASYSRLRDSPADSNSNSSTAEDADYDTAPSSLVCGLEAAFAGTPSPRRPPSYRSKQTTPQPSLSSAEDESGFSSMGSFQEVGLPLMNSTQVGGGESPWHSRGSFHEVGLPAVPPGKPPVPIHRRWSSNPVEALSRYQGYKGAEAIRVLWV